MTLTERSTVLGMVTNLKIVSLKCTKDCNPPGTVTGLGRRSTLGRVTFILRRYTTLRRTMFVLPTKPLYKLRGGIIIKKWENLEFFQSREGGSKKQTKKSKIQIRTFFSKCLNYKLLSGPILKKKN